MMKNDLVSVIILSYNNLEYYSECLDSVLCQSYSNIEIIIADDESKKFDKNVIVDYIERNKNSNILNYSVYSNERNMGIVKNFNTAIKKSKGKYIVPLAIDDVLNDKDVVNDVVKFFVENKCLICTGYSDVYDSEMKKLVGKRPSEYGIEILKNSSPSELFSILKGENFISAPATNYTRDFFDEYGYFDEEYKLLEDWPKMLSISKKGCKIKYIDRCIEKYRFGGISTNKFFSRNILDLDVKKIIKEFDECVSFENKKLVVWGTGYCYKKSKDKLKEFDISYAVDSDVEKQGMQFDNLKIYNPSKLLDEKAEEILIIVCSSHYLSISNWLNKNGFAIDKNYISVNAIK